MNKETKKVSIFKRLFQKRNKKPRNITNDQKSNQK